MRKLSDSEIKTTALAIAFNFGGHLDNGLGFMKMTKLVPAMLAKSRFNRRLHQLSELIFLYSTKSATILKVWQGHRNI